MIREKYLPIGTVVILKNGEKKLMITGFNPSTNDENGTTSFDYSGCYYPEGVLNSNESYLFNHDMIDNVCFIGYEDDESKIFMEMLKVDIKDFNKDNLINNGDDKPELIVPKNRSDVFEKLRV